MGRRCAGPAAAAERRARSVGVADPVDLQAIIESCSCPEATMLTRRTFLKASLLTALGQSLIAKRLEAQTSGTWVNDVHSQLNPTKVLDVLQPSSIAEVQEAIRSAQSKRRLLSVAGARHAAGGQQFASGEPLLDMSRMNRIRGLDHDRGTVEAEAGITWPELEAHLVREQRGKASRWCVAQKQGVPLMSLGGTLSANAHGNTFGRGPIISDVESFQLVDARGRVLPCSRTEHPDLFRLAIGGYGLFGVITSIRLQLVRARMMKSVAELVRTQDIPSVFEQRRAAGMLNGEFQFVTDSGSGGFLRSGILLGSVPATSDSVPGSPETALTDVEWLKLVGLAHVRPGAAFDLYSKRFLASAGRVAWSDDPPRDVVYVPGYHQSLDRQSGAEAASSEVLMEFFMPRDRVPEFMEQARSYFLE